MAERPNQATHKSDFVSETEFPPRFNSVSRLTAAPGNPVDDLIQALQNQRENARARQVFEWEIVRRQSPPVHRRDAV